MTRRRRAVLGAWATAALACAGITIWAIATVGTVVLVLLSGAAPG